MLSQYHKHKKEKTLWSRNEIFSVVYKAHVKNEHSVSMCMNKFQKVLQRI